MPRLLPRTMASLLAKAARQFPAVVLTGPRRSGKTTLVQAIFARSHAYASFDDPQAVALATEDPALFLDRHPPPVILDEIQYVPALLRHIKLEIDRRPALRGRFILIGSQQFPLMRGITESLAGRAAVLNLLPMSWVERLGFPRARSGLLAGSAKVPRLPTQALARGWIRGGLPALVADPRLDRALWYSSYLQTYLERDVRSLRDVGSLVEFQRFLGASAARNAQLLSLSDLARDLGTAVNTVKAWIAVLQASHQAVLLRPYFRNLGKRLVKTPKLYFTDTGLACHLIGLSDPGHALTGPAAGALLETAVLGELLRGFANRGESPRIYFWRTASGEEVDFLLEARGRVIPVEVKLTKTPTAHHAAPVERFLDLFQERADHGYVVCLLDEPRTLTRRVKAVPFLWSTGI